MFESKVIILFCLGLKVQFLVHEKVKFTPHSYFSYMCF